MAEEPRKPRKSMADMQTWGLDGLACRAPTANKPIGGEKATRIVSLQVRQVISKMRPRTQQTIAVHAR